MDALWIVVIGIVIGIFIGFVIAKHIFKKKSPKNVGTLFVIGSEGNPPDIYMTLDLTLGEVISNDTVSLKISRQAE